MTHAPKLVEKCVEQDDGKTCEVGVKDQVRDGEVWDGGVGKGIKFCSARLWIAAGAASTTKGRLPASRRPLPRDSRTRRGS